MYLDLDLKGGDPLDVALESLLDQLHRVHELLCGAPL
jgi:hypothetical protein